MFFLLLYIGNLCDISANEEDAMSRDGTPFDRTCGAFLAMIPSHELNGLTGRWIPDFLLRPRAAPVLRMTSTC
jgi:hypothetical protein